MATISLSVNKYTEAKEILEKCYEMDRSSGYSRNGNSVVGSVITANIRLKMVKEGFDLIKKHEVEINSNYYSESNLREMF